MLFPSSLEVADEAVVGPVRCTFLAPLIGTEWRLRERGAGVVDASPVLPVVVSERSSTIRFRRKQGGDLSLGAWCFVPSANAHTLVRYICPSLRHPDLLVFAKLLPQAMWDRDAPLDVVFCERRRVLPVESVDDFTDVNCRDYGENLWTYVSHVVWSKLRKQLSPEELRLDDERIDAERHARCIQDSYYRSNPN